MTRFGDRSLKDNADWDRTLCQDCVQKLLGTALKPRKV